MMLKFIHLILEINYIATHVRIMNNLYVRKWFLCFNTAAQCISKPVCLQSHLEMLNRECDMINVLCWLVKICARLNFFGNTVIQIML